MRLLRTVLTSAAVLAAAPAMAWQGPPPPRAVGAIAALVSAVRTGDVENFHTLRDAAGPIGVRIATWRILREGIAGDLSTYAAFLQHHAHWPNVEQVRARAESRLSGADPAEVLDWLAANPAQTTGGLLAQVRAEQALGRDVSATLRVLWLDRELTAGIEDDLLARFGEALRPLAAERLENLLWRGETEAATRMLPRVGAGPAALARARLALQARADGVNALIAAVPAALADDPGLAHDRFRWRLARGLNDEAVALLLERSPDRLGRPAVWAAQRARLARLAMQAGEPQRAYDLAARHGLTDHGADRVELEWLAGYTALRFLNRPADALTHFRALRERSVSPITLSRAGFWEGRAQEALGDAAAADTAYHFAAQHQTAFYGLMAAERLGMDLDPLLVNPPRYPDWRDTALARSDLLQAALLLHSAGQFYEARRFVLQLATTLSDEAELGALAQLWLDRGEPHFALRIAKEAITRGILLHRAYFPLSPLAEAELAVPADLALAIARRESEFDHRVSSHADARGLMQVLPATGAHTARRLGIAYDEDRLSSDPAYNAILGAGYLQEMSALFGGTLSLVSAAYNAGPGRPSRWVQELGDPRDPAVDPLDWVEMIPFAETRNYVMRVTESVVIYRAVLAGQPGPVRLTALLRGAG